MIKVLALCLLAALVAAAPQNNVDGNLDEILRNIASMGFPVPGPTVTILRYEFTPPSGDGAYNLYYVLSDGTQVAESGALREDGVYAKKGFYSFLINKDQQQTVKYSADEKGFDPDVIVEPPGSVDPSFAAAAIG